MNKSQADQRDYTQAVKRNYRQSGVSQIPNDVNTG
jgi:hypothetical protein